MAKYILIMYFYGNLTFSAIKYQDMLDYVKKFQEKIRLSWLIYGKIGEKVC